MSAAAAKDYVMNLFARLNTRDLDNKIEETQEKVKNANLKILTGMRRTVQMGIHMSISLGAGLDQSLGMTVEAGLLSVELIAGVAAAGSITGFGAGKFAAQFGTIAALLITIAQVRAGRTRIAQRMQGIVNGFRLLSF